MNSDVRVIDSDFMAHDCLEDLTLTEIGRFVALSNSHSINPQGSADAVLLDLGVIVCFHSV